MDRALGWAAYNRAKIAKQCKHCTNLELISDFYQTRF